MSNEELPQDFDIVILGTGLTATITAAAFSRIGLKVLHLDRNDYYGGLYANFNLTAIQGWKQKNQDLIKDGRASGAEKKDKASLPDDLKCISLPQEEAQAFNLSSSFHIRERTAEEEEAAKKLRSSFKPFFAVSKPKEPESESKDVCEGEETLESLNKENASQSQNKCEEAGQDTTSAKEESSGNQCVPVSEETSVKSEKDKCASANDVQPIGEQSDTVSGCEKSSDCESSADSGPKNEDEIPDKLPGESKESNQEKVEPAQSKKKEWTVGDINDEWRRFCFDLSPKVLFCCGSIIELLVRSDVARYCEFRTVSRVLTVLKDKLEPVPCSRADVFGSKIVSLIEKRLMMKFLQFAADYENHPEEYEGHKNSTFPDFLKFKKLTPNLQHFVQHAIAMVDDSSSTEHGLTRTRKFLQSLGRYGNTAFLFPLYGTGELSQAFARMSAVFGGVYCLMETATHLLADADNKCCGIVTSKGQKINCKYLVAESSYLPANYIKRLSLGKVSRGIYITDASINPSSDEDLTLLNFICKQNSSRPVTVLEIPPSACVCPPNLFVVYLSRVSDSDEPEEDLSEVKERLFASADSASNVEDDRPHILWSMHFTLNDWSELDLTDQAVENVLVCSDGGDAEIDLDKCVPEAKRLFHQVCPDEEFLPTPPNPEDIIHVDDEESPVVTGNSPEFESGTDNPEGKGEEGSESSKASDQENQESPMTASSTGRWIAR